MSCLIPYSKQFFVSIKILIYIKITSSHEGNLKTEKIKNFGAQFFEALWEFWCHVCTTRKCIPSVIFF